MNDQIRTNNTNFEVKNKPRKSKTNEGSIGKIVKGVIYLTVLISILVLVILVGFIILKSIPVFENTSLSGFLFSSTWDPESGKFGIGMLIIMTIVLLAIAMIIAIPITLFSTIFISEYLKPQQQKVVMTIVKLLAGVPSVVFGLFARDQIGAFYRLLGANTNDNLMVAATTMAFMAIPTMVSLSYNAVRSVPDSHRFAALGLGISKEKTAFKTVRKSVMLEIISAVIMGMARVIGETMAIMMIAGNSTSPINISNGIGGFLFSSIQTLAATIGLEMLENKGAAHESALYAIGLFLFVLVFIINITILIITNAGKWKLHRKMKRESKYHAKLKEQNIEFEDDIIKKRKVHFSNEELAYMVKNKTENKFWKLAYSGFVLVNMWISTTLIVVFTFWILGDVLIRGLAGLQHYDAFIAIEGQSGIFAALLTTILLILATLILAIPLALGTAIFLNEYAHKDSRLTKSFRFMINILTSTPSIIFGIFGLAIFVNLFGLSFSVLAAALTMMIVILPMLINNFENGLIAVPNELREAGAALGLSKTRRLFVIVLPNAMEGIITGIILSMARIIGESAPVYLTLGTAIRMPTEGFLSQGATLTTAIYMLASEAGPGKGESIAYLISMMTIIFVLSLNFASGRISRFFVGNKQEKTQRKLELFKQYCKEFDIKVIVKEKKNKFNTKWGKLKRSLELDRIVRNFKLWRIRRAEYLKIKKGGRK